MKDKISGAQGVKLEKKVSSIEQEEKELSKADNEYRESHYRGVLIFVTAMLCLGIAAAGVILTTNVFRNNGDASVVTSGVVDSNVSTNVYSVDSFSTDNIYNSTPQEQISTGSSSIITAPPAMTTAATVPESKSDAEEIQPDDTSAQPEDTVGSKPAAGTAVSITERGYNGNVLFG